MSDLERLEKLEEILSDLDYNNGLLKDEILLAEEIINLIVPQLENNTKALDEISRYLKSSGGPRDTVSRIKQGNDLVVSQVEKKLEIWLRTRNSRQPLEKPDK